MSRESSVFHVITSTEVGGAERMLEKFLVHHPSSDVSILISLTTVGAIGKRLQEMGITVDPLRMRSFFGAVIGALTYWRLIRKYRPKYVIAWMYHANALTSFYSVLGIGPPVVWNIRCGLSDFNSWRWTQKGSLKLCKILSASPQRIVFNSFRALKQHVEHGFPENKCEVIYNGFESSSSIRSHDDKLRQQLGISTDAFLIGSFGRNEPIKRMADLLIVCANLRKLGCPAEILYVGRKFDTQDFRKKIRLWDLESYIHILSERPDLRCFYEIIDVFCICSESEGFPNVIGEAVYSHVPVFCTDISDMKAFFLQYWQVSPVGNIDSLVVSAHRIYQMDIIERKNLIFSQRNSYRTKTDIGAVIPRLAGAFFEY